MKTFTTFTTVVALIAGISIASAQNAPTTTPKPAPNSINKGDLPNTPSGSQSQGAAKSSAGMANRKVTGKSKFCMEQSRGGSLNCTFATMAACEQAAKPKGTQCSQNPSIGTTGSK